MVALDTFFAVFALIPFCLSYTVLPASDPFPRLRDTLTRRSAHVPADRWLPRPRHDGLRKRQNGGIPTLPRGEDVPVHTRSRMITQRRSLGNGSIIDLATAHSTYTVPVIFGSPPAAYPLQLDLGSSDLVLASTLCGDKCPQPDGNSINPYYDVQRHSASFEAVNANQTWWGVGFADTRTAGGFVARENVSIGNSQVQGQVFGLINATNLTLAEQEISGIMGLGFPRLSVIARSLLGSQRDGQTSLESSSASSTLSASAEAASAAASPPSSSAYLPTFLESLVTAPHIPYPVFGLALAPPFVHSSSSASTSSAAPSPSARFASSIGSLTFGGVSSLYVSEQPGSGLTRDDIEWHQVVPFGRISTGNDTIQGSSTESVAGSGLPSSEIPASASSSEALASSVSVAARKRQETSTSDPAASSASASASAATPASAAPQSLLELEEEEYLYWTIQLANVSVNGTDIGLESTYAFLNIPPIALLDAGFNGISGPIAQVAKIFADIAEARQSSTGQWAVPCDTKMTLGFSFGGRYVQLQPSEWMYASIASSSFCLAWPVGTDPAADGIDWQLGTPFLKKVYSIFSYGINGEQAPLVGFLPIPNPVASGASTSASASASSASSSTEASISSSSVPQLSAYGPTPTTVEANQVTATVATELPNAVLPVPTYSLPSYIYDRDPPVTVGVLQTLGLANASAYEVSEVPIILAPNVSDTTSTNPSAVGIGGTNTDGGAHGGATVGVGFNPWTAVVGVVGVYLMTVI